MGCSATKNEKKLNQQINSIENFEQQKEESGQNHIIQQYQRRRNIRLKKILQQREEEQYYNKRSVLDPLFDIHLKSML